MSNWGHRHDYEGFHDRDSYCYIKVNGSAVLCTDVENRDGSSVTNFAGMLATQVCLKYRIPFESLTWIEHHHYDRSSYLYHDEDNFYLVEFDIVDRPSPAGRMMGKRFVNPRWKPADMDYVRRTFGV